MYLDSNNNQRLLSRIIMILAFFVASVTSSSAYSQSIIKSRIKSQTVASDSPNTIVSSGPVNVDGVYVVFGNTSESAITNGEFLDHAISVMSYEHDLSVNRDVASGKLTGRRVHQPVKLTLLAGPYLIGFVEKLVTNAALDEVNLVFTRGKGTSLESQLWIMLGNARIGEVRECFESQFVIELLLYYQKIEWHWLSGEGGEVEDRVSPEDA